MSLLDISSVLRGLIITNINFETIRFGDSSTRRVFLNYIIEKYPGGIITLVDHMKICYINPNYNESLDVLKSYTKNCGSAKLSFVDTLVLEIILALEWVVNAINSSTCTSQL